MAPLSSVKKRNTHQFFSGEDDGGATVLDEKSEPLGCGGGRERHGSVAGHPAGPGHHHVGQPRTRHQAELLVGPVSLVQA